MIDIAYKRAKAFKVSPAAVPSDGTERALAMLADLSIETLPEAPTLQSVLDNAQDLKESREDVLSLCRRESTMLYHLATSWFTARPELVQDEKRQSLPVTGDKYISQSIFDMTKDLVEGVTVSEYIHRLLLIVDQTSYDESLRKVVLQELSNVCHMEYRRVRRQFRHSLQRGHAKYLVRIPGGLEDGITQVQVMNKPDLKRDPQLHYLLSLCQESEPAKAIALVRKIDQLHRSDPQSRDQMHTSEYEAFSNLATTAGFIMDISTVLSMPAKGGKKNQFYTPRSKALAFELNSVKEAIDLSAYAAPMTKLLDDDKKGMKIWEAFDTFVLDKTGTKLETLYEDLIEQSLENLHAYHIQQQTKTAQNKTALQPYVPIVGTSTPAERIEQRREKDKSRPAHSSFFYAPVVPIEEPQEEVAPLILKVKQNTFNTFSILFSRGVARGSIHWTAFEAAMVDLGFAVVPMFGSVYTFSPPAGMGVQKALTVHRPHQPRIEGHILLVYAARLRRVYGWGPDTFELG
ncbi:hypothetical protein VTL71DRAFT_4283 [Oculimacula yallundae]|uniref:Ipa protein n=1 Tax=Oculimacula yallundae TaxID=86028 RepID=A0ABR4C664_9HELO